MPDLPPTQNISDPNLAIPPAPTINTPSQKRFNPFHLWRRNRWIFLALTAGVVIVLLGISLIALTLYTQLANKTTGEDPKSNNQTEVKPTATHNSDDDDFFAKQPLTVLYYSFAQTTGSKNMFQSTPSDKENRVLDIGYPDKYQFSTSPDGKWLLRWNNTTIERAAAASPQKFNSIYELNQDDSKITSVVWQADTNAIAISSGQTQSQNADETKQNQIIIFPLLTLQPVMVYDQQIKFDIKLIKFPTANSLYFVEILNGAERNLTQFNPQSKQVERQYSALNQNNLLTKLQFSADMQSAYQVTDTQVIHYNIQTMEQTVIYTVNRECAEGKPNNNVIAFASIAPSTNKLIVTENLTQCSRQPRNRSTEPTPVPPTSQTIIYSLTEKKALVTKFNLELPQLESSSWSPGEDYIWLTIDTQNTQIVSVDKLALSPVPALKRQSVTRERAFIIGWLQP